MPRPDQPTGDPTPQQPVQAEAPSTIIQATRGLRFLDMREMFRFRELLFFLIWRDIKVRYKQTAIGVLWAVLQPLAMMAIATIFFGKLGGMEDQTGGIPYVLFAFAGLLPWQLFSRTLTESSNSLVTDQRLVTKVYFPRILVPMASCLAAVVDFLVCSVLMVGMMLGMGHQPTMQVLWLPLFVALMLMTSMGVGFWLSALNTEYRDVRYVVPFLAQLWLFATPVVYPASIVPERFRFLIGFNPMTGVVEGFRWSLLGAGEGPGLMMFVSVSLSLFIFISGIVWFRWRERTFVDHLGGQ